ncbi:hypothetical protein EVAR_91277_1 [Eumeta japonica]|uniref:RNA-directed DNA polymerase n=1 Tax=Eumeta variegata TaxID=151549 RepID=A0A4C1TB77_EUMVA|nr:hypothetical protein EVAR_91277_1 [Eumeta japonica]
MIAHTKGHFGAKKTQDYVEKYFFIPGLAAKIPRVIGSCVECLVVNAKLGKKEGFFAPIDKGDEPLDAVLDRLQKQSAVFGNPRRIITDRGAAFTSRAFEQYCEEEGIQHLLITTGVPRGNGQVERMHKVLVPMLAKLSRENPDRWYKVVRKPRHDRYEVEKVGEGEGPRHTSTASEYMKRWSSVFEPNTGSGGPNVGIADMIDIMPTKEHQQQLIWFIQRIAVNSSTNDRHP